MITAIFRTSCPEPFFKIAALKISKILTGVVSFLMKLQATPVQVFSSVIQNV